MYVLGGYYSHVGLPKMKKGVRGCTTIYQPATLLQERYF